MYGNKHNKETDGYSVPLEPRVPKVSIIIPVMNERKTLAAVIRQARRVHRDTEVIVVCNGSVDGSIQIARKLGVRVIRYERPLGHDVGRSVGARAASGDILLFLDGDIAIPAPQLFAFVKAIEAGADVALNKYVGPVHNKPIHPVVLSKHALNLILGKPELRGMSMTAIPHAISRKALERIGAENLAVPPKAQAMAAAYGLQIEAVKYVRVGKNNPGKRRWHSVQDLIVGDHLEAVHWYLNHWRRESEKPVEMTGLSGGRI